MNQSQSSSAAAATIVTEDAFLGGRIMIRQPLSGYRAGLDAIMLAASVPAEPASALILDVGAGVGVVGLAVAWRLAGTTVTLLEREAAYAALARVNVGRNGLGAWVRVAEADLAAPLAELGEVGISADAFDHVVANPPYLDAARARPPADPLRRAAHAMPADGLARWVRFMAAVVRPGGRATIVHRAERLGDLLGLAEGRFGDLVVFPLYPREGAPAERVLISGVKGSRAPLRLRRGLVLHEADGRFTAGASRILMDGAPLDIF